jgi:hypothetical protein
VGVGLDVAESGREHGRVLGGTIGRSPPNDLSLVDFAISSVKTTGIWEKRGSYAQKDWFSPPPLRR